MKLDRILQSHNIFLYERKDDEQQNSRFKKEKILISVHINTQLPVLIRFRILSYVFLAFIKVCLHVELTLCFDQYSVKS